MLRARSLLKGNQAWESRWEAGIAPCPRLDVKSAINTAHDIRRKAPERGRQSWTGRGRRRFPFMSCTSIPLNVLAQSVVNKDRKPWMGGRDNYLTAILIT